MSRKGENGLTAMAVPAGLLEALMGRQAPQSPEERRKGIIESFNKVLDEALGGCPGAKEDPEHRQRDESLLTLLKASYFTGGLPEPVAEAVLRVLAFRALHAGDDGKGIAALFDQDGGIVGTALLVAGAVLRVKDTPETAGIRLSTGLYA